MVFGTILFLLPIIPVIIIINNMLRMYTTIIMAMTSYWELKLARATTKAADEFLIAVPSPRTGFVFFDGPPNKYPIVKAANTKIKEANNAPVPNTARKSL